jgi:hypothetical protein
MYSDRVTPYRLRLSRPAPHIRTRYFTPQEAHPSLAVSGGCCLASACLIPGTIPRSAMARHAVAYEVPVGLADQSFAGGGSSMLPTPLLTSDDREPKEYDINIENPAGLLATRIRVGGWVGPPEE